MDYVEKVSKLKRLELEKEKNTLDRANAAQRQENRNNSSQICSFCKLERDLLDDDLCVVCFDCSAFNHIVCLENNGHVVGRGELRFICDLCLEYQRLMDLQLDVEEELEALKRNWGIIYGISEEYVRSKLAEQHLKDSNQRRPKRQISEEDDDPQEEKVIKKPSISVDPNLCAICQEDVADDSFDETMILCDGCELGFHVRCTYPRLLFIPGGDWFCKKCTRQRKEKGSKDGDEAEWDG